MVGFDPGGVAANRHRSLRPLRGRFYDSFIIRWSPLRYDHRLPSVTPDGVEAPLPGGMIFVTLCPRSTTLKGQK